LRKNKVETGGVVHGALDFAELENLGFSPAEIVDFSVNSNPGGPSPLAKAALGRVNIERYPDRACLELRRAILEHDLPAADLGLENLLCGNGTNELIWAVARAFLRPGATAAILGPTFGEYRQASLVAGARVVEFTAAEQAKFKPDIPGLLEWLEKVRPNLLWLCNPNNPTGQLLSTKELEKIFAYCRPNGIIPVVDEAYRRFAPAAGDFSALNLVKEASPVVLRSLTKDYALAGLRLGYVASNPQVISEVARQLPAWNVNAAAQAVGVAALQDQPHLARTLAALRAEQAAFFEALASFKLVPSTTHFCLLEVGDAKEIRRQLLQKKILVRDCASFGLPGYIRVATRPEWPLLIEGLRKILESEY
jgi:histidinol-phosphate aminotransferase